MYVIYHQSSITAAFYRLYTHLPATTGCGAVESNECETSLFFWLGADALTSEDI